MNIDIENPYRRGGARRWSRAAGALALCAAGAARGEAPPTAVLAETLFQEGKKLMAAGDLTAACPKLAESQRLEPGLGVQLALAVCHERQGKLAAAWVDYRAAAATAQRQRDPSRERLAAERLAALEQVLPRLQITVPLVSRPPGFSLQFDGEALPEAAWGVPFPVDPGEHTIEAQAPAHQPLRLELKIAPGAATRVVELPPLLARPAAPSAAPPEGPAPSARPAASAPVPATPARRGTARSVAYGLGAGGAVAVGVGTALGLLAWSRQSSARDLCPVNPCTNPRALGDNHSADQLATGANVSFLVGGVALGAAALLLVLGPSQASASASGPVFRF